MNPAASWTRIALAANRLDFTADPGADRATPEQGGPTLSSRALALVHLAMNDAYFSKIGTQPTWLPGLTASDNSAPDGSMAAAAEAVLRALYRKPAQVAALDKAHADYVATTPVPPVAMAWGREVARRILAAREDDLRLAGWVHGPSSERYRHRPDPFNPGQGLTGQQWGQCPPFCVGLKPLAAPPHWSTVAGMPNAHYAVDFAEVAAKGSLTGSTRSADETVQGIFWAYDGAHDIGTSPRLYCQIALHILDRIEAATPGSLGTDDYLHILTLITAVMADAGIQAWHWKYHYDLWRPVVGIREADPSLGTNATPGPIVQARTDWAPLGAPGTNLGRRGTPDFPAYPSGHATFGAAALQVLRLSLEKRKLVEIRPAGEVDCVSFDFVSDEYNGQNTDPDGSRRPLHRRSFPSLWRAIVENAESRVYLGVHWRFDGISVACTGGVAGPGSPSKPSELGNVGGVPLGLEIANSLMATGLHQHS